MSLSQFCVWPHQGLLSGTPLFRHTAWSPPGVKPSLAASKTLLLLYVACLPKKCHMGDVKVCVWHKLFLDPWSRRCSGFWMHYHPRLSWLSRAPLESLLRRLFPWKSLNKIYTLLSLSRWWVGPLPYCSSRVHLAYFPLLICLWLKDYLCMLFFWSSFSYFKTLLLCSFMFWHCTSGPSGERCLCHNLNRLKGCSFYPRCLKWSTSSTS